VVVNHRGPHIAVAKERLNRANVVPTCKRMSAGTGYTRLEQFSSQVYLLSIEQVEKLNNFKQNMSISIF
jgi:hypothetical protein